MAAYDGIDYVGWTGDPCLHKEGFQQPVTYQYREIRETQIMK